VAPAIVQTGVETADAVVDRAVGVAEVVAVDVDRAVVDVAVMVGLGTREIGHEFSRSHPAGQRGRD
jgi:hypothetical protein